MRGLTVGGSLKTPIKDWVAIALLIIVGCIGYLNSFDVPFHFDDESNIKDNIGLKLEAFTPGELEQVFTKSLIRTRPVSNFSFALNYYLGGHRVQGYHLVNLMVHILAGIFLFYLVRHTLGLPINRAQYKNGTLIALFSALIWLVHPLATQSVTYIVQRMNSMSAMFFLLAMLCFARGRAHQLTASGDDASPWAAWRWHACCVVAGLLAVGSKEIAATLPFFLVLYEWYFHQDASWQWLKNKLSWVFGALLAFAVITTLYTGGNFLERIFGNNCSGRDFTTIERVLTQFRVVVHYISLIFYPHPDRLTLDYDFPLSTSLLSPVTTLTSLAGIVSLLALAMVLLRRERLISFCILWFFGNLAIESSVICLEMVFEHRTYLPSAFLILAVVALAYRFGKSIPVVASIGGLLMGLFAYWTYERNTVWQSPISLWSDAVKKAPEKARIYSNLGRAYALEKEFVKAEQNLQKALALASDAPIPHYNLAIVFEQQGRKTEAESEYRKALALKSDYAEARVGLGGILRERELYQDAIDEFRQALVIAPNEAIVNKHLGNALLRAGNPNEALPYLRDAAAGLPKDFEVSLDIGEVLIRLGRYDEAIEIYRRILNQDRNQGSAHYHLGMLLNAQGKWQEAVDHYREVDRLMRFPPEAKYDYANALLRNGEISKAQMKYDEFLELGSVLAMAHNNKGLSLVSQGKIDEAILQFEDALRLAPSFQVAENNLKMALNQLGVGEREGRKGPSSTKKKIEK